MSSLDSVLVRARKRLEATAHSQLEPCVKALAALEGKVGQPVRVTILGEGNTGKTSLANRLAGCPILPTSVVQNTRTAMLLRYDRRLAVHAQLNGRRREVDLEDALSDIDSADLRLVDIGVPLASLKGLEILDTPAVAGAEKLALSADIAVWCTSATRAWAESERAAWHRLPARLRLRSILAVTRSDMLRCREDQAHVEARLQDAAGGLFRHIVMTSARERSDEGTDRSQIAACLHSLAETLRSRRNRAACALVRRLARMALANAGWRHGLSADVAADANDCLEGLANLQPSALAREETRETPPGWGYAAAISTSMAALGSADAHAVSL